MHNLNTCVFSLESLAVANPGAGNNLTIAPSTAIRIELISLSFLLTCDANAANRLVTLTLSNGSIIVPFSATPGFQTANEAITYYFSQGMVNSDASASIQSIFAPLPRHLYFDPGDSLITDIFNIQVGDAITNVVYRFKYWYAY